MIQKDIGGGKDCEGLERLAIELMIVITETICSSPTRLWYGKMLYM